MIAAVATAADQTRRGRTRVTPKALDRVVSAVAAEALGVDAGRVDVELADDVGALALVVSTPIRVASLRLVQSDRSGVHRAGGSILERTAQAHETIRDRVSAVTGSAIGQVTVRISGVSIQPEKRVR